MAISRRTLALGGLAAVLTRAIPVSALADDGNLVNELKAGGYVILLRHGATNPGQGDTERNLSDEGKAMAKSFGVALRAIGAPVGKVYTSLLSRAYETAALAGLSDITRTIDLTETSAAMGPPSDIEAGRSVAADEKSRRADALRKLLGTMPKGGTDTVIVTHKPNIIDALGSDWTDVKEGEASVFRPGPNGSYRLVARVQMDEWPRLVAAR